MDLNVLLRGIIIGFSVAAPVGPIGLLCIRRTLAQGRLTGLLSGLGAATADALYGVVAGFGITLISNFLIDPVTQFVVRLIGGGFLVYLGVKIFRSKIAEKPAEAQANTLLSAYLSTLVLTLTNPATIILYAGIFAGMNIGATAGDYGSAVLLVLGLFVGSLAWWLLLSTGVGWLSTRLNLNLLNVVNRVSGVIITAFGVVAILSLMSAR